MRKPMSAERGFSLIEILVSVALLSLVVYLFLSYQNKNQRMMLKGISRDAHVQIVEVAKSRSGKALQQIWEAAKNDPAALEPLLNQDLDLGEGIRLKWAKPSTKRGQSVSLKFSSNADEVVREALRTCRGSKTHKAAWQGLELSQRLASNRLVFCGQLETQGNPDLSYGAQHIAQAKTAFILLETTYSRVIDGAPIPLSAFGEGGTLATIKWTMAWSYEKGQETVQQFRKGVFHIVP